MLQLVVLPHLHTTSGDEAIFVSSTPPPCPLLLNCPVNHKYPLSVTMGYSMSQAKRCHAVLQLMCLGDRNHTTAEIPAALQGQTQRWFMPCQLEPGMVVCDNDTNLLSALRQGKWTHVPCLAHVLNLVMQYFLNRYPGLEDLLKQARRV